ncbi:MAG: hypothetical protein LQ338_004143 [Usnochroma carphineum]|nr:MAG: hypothetical protein LQ338_004143 [Usnochroma carphineum]
MPLQEASEIWQDPEHMPSNPAILLDTMCLQAANVLAAAAQLAPLDKVEILSHEIRFQILSRAKAVDSELATWPFLVPQDWWPVTLERSSIPQDIVNAGLHGDHCDVYPDTCICGIWLSWYSTRLKIFGIVADFDQIEYKMDAVLRIQQTVDFMFAAVPFMLGSKSKPAGLFEYGFKYPCLPGQSISRAHYHAAAAFGGHTLWPPLKAILEHKRHLRPDQAHFAIQQLRRLRILYDARMPDESGTR